MTATKLPLGHVVATPGALAALAAAGRTPAELIERHRTGDWGDVSAEDARLNDSAVRDGDRILSAYLVGGERLWVISEADRSATCVLLPGEY